MFRKNMAGQGVYAFAYDKTTGLGQTGDAANITALISKDGGATAALTDTNPTEIGGGWYWFDVSQTESNADAIVIIPTSITANILVKDIHIETDKGVFSDGAGVGAGSLGAATGLVQNESLVSSADQATATREEMDSNSTQLAAIVEDTGTTIPASITALPAAVWAVVLNGTKTAGDAILDLWRRMVGNTHSTDKDAGTQQFYNPDGTTGDGVSVDEDGNRTTT